MNRKYYLIFGIVILFFIIFFIYIGGKATPSLSGWLFRTSTSKAQTLYFVTGKQPYFDEGTVLRENQVRTITLLYNIYPSTNKTSLNPEDIINKIKEGINYYESFNFDECVNECETEKEIIIKKCEEAKTLKNNLQSRVQILACEKLKNRNCRIECEETEKDFSERLKCRKAIATYAPIITYREIDLRVKPWEWRTAVFDKDGRCLGLAFDLDSQADPSGIGRCGEFDIPEYVSDEKARDILLKYLEERNINANITQSFYIYYRPKSLGRFLFNKLFI